MITINTKRAKRQALLQRLLSLVLEVVEVIVRRKSGPN